MPQRQHSPGPGHLPKATGPSHAWRVWPLAVAVLFMLALACPRPAQAQWEVAYLTEEYYPFNYTDNGEIKGISADLLRQVWAELGETERPIMVMPWARAYDRALNVSNTMLFSMARIPQRENLFRWAGPIATTRFVLIAKKSAHIVLPSMGQAEGFRIGTVRDDVSDWLLQPHADRNRIEPVADMRQNIRKLENDRLDMLAYEESAWRQLAIKNGLSPDDYETVFVLRVTPVFFAFNLDVPPPVVHNFQKALDRIKASGRYQAILDAYLH